MLHKPSILLGPHHRIWIVDDVADMRLLLKLRLEREGYLVATASCYSEVVQLIHQQGLPHLILIDVLLPKEDGFATAKMVRRLGNVPLIFLSAQADPTFIAKARNEFAAAYVIKPFLFATLLTHIQHLLLPCLFDANVATLSIINGPRLSQNSPSVKPTSISSST